MELWLIASALITVIFVAIFFIPAYKRYVQLADKKSILIINAILVWTIVGGLVAFIRIFVISRL